MQLWPASLLFYFYSLLTTRYSFLFSHAHVQDHP